MADQRTEAAAPAPVTVVGLPIDDVQSWMRTTLLSRRVPLAFVCAILALLAVGALSYRGMLVSSESERAVSHSHQVLEHLQGLSLASESVKTAYSGFVLMGKSSYTESYRANRLLAEQGLATVRDLTADNPTQQQRVAALEALTASQIRLAEIVIGIRQTSGLEAAVAMVSDGRSKTITDEFHGIIREMQGEERRLLVLRNADSALRVGQFKAVLILGTALGLLITASAGWNVQRDSARRNLAETALLDKNIELRAAVAELEAFSYSVSHDLRAPLRAIDGFSQILLKDHGCTMAVEPSEHLRSIRNNAMRMGRLIDDLLEFARVGRANMGQHPIAMSAIVDDAVREVRGGGASHPVTVTVGNLPQIRGDGALIKQVFVNLVGNAFKYTRLTDHAAVEIGARDINGEHVLFVRDNGAGFDMKYAGKLFGVFHRMHRTEEFEGTGVGLAIVQRIVQRHGGRVWAEAAVNQGATIYFTLEAANHA